MPTVPASAPASGSPIFIASDHAGFALKKCLLEALHAEGIVFIDLGCHDEERCDYPDFAHTLCKEVLAANVPGILICGTGIGMSMAANRHPGIRAALCTHEFHARAAREHNDANVLCLGERVTALGLALELTRAFLNTPFGGGRHAPRVQKIETA